MMPSATTIRALARLRPNQSPLATGSNMPSPTPGHEHRAGTGQRRAHARSRGPGPHPSGPRPAGCRAGDRRRSPRCPGTSGAAAAPPASSAPGWRRRRPPRSEAPTPAIRLATKDAASTSAESTERIRGAADQQPDDREAAGRPQLGEAGAGQLGAPGDGRGGHEHEGEERTDSRDRRLRATSPGHAASRRPPGPHPRVGRLSAAPPECGKPDNHGHLADGPVLSRRWRTLRCACPDGVPTAAPARGVRRSAGRRGRAG